MDKRYVILELSDAKALADFVSKSFSAYAAPTAMTPVIERIAAETGADMEDIVAQLKGIETCAACVIESQEDYCVCWKANKLGRRLSRLVDRANGKLGFVEEPGSRASRARFPALVENVLGRAQPEAPEAAAYSEAVRKCQIEASQDIETALANSLHGLTTGNHAMGNFLLREVNGRIAREINAWRTRYSDVIEFQSGDYCATGEEAPQEGRINIMWSDAFRELSQGRARVRMVPLPKHFEG